MPTENEYTDEQLTTLIELYFRDFHRPMPYRVIAERMGVHRGQNAMQRLLWGVCTGYGGVGTVSGTNYRRTALRWPEGLEEYRAGATWWPREDRALGHALERKGQERTPACDTAYIAAVLARPLAEVEARWAWLRAGGHAQQQGGGFGLAEEVK
jgi:hypothetical protein